jgi:hypothetical protein
MQDHHNCDFKKEVLLPKAKRQKPNIAEKLFDNSDNGKMSLIKFVNVDVNTVAYYDSKILDCFPAIALEAKTNKIIKLETDMFDVLPIINKIFIRRDFEIKLSLVIHEDAKMLNPVLIINTIKFIKKYATWETVYNLCVNKNKWLYNYIYTCLEYSNDHTYLSKLYSTTITLDKSEEKYIIKMISNIFKSICDDNINTMIDKKPLMVSLDFSCISNKFIENLPQVFAKYFMSKFLSHKHIFGQNFRSNK